MATLFVRSGGVWREVETRVRRSGAWGVTKVNISHLMSTVVYVAPTWVFSDVASRAQNKFSDGTNKNLIYATGSSSVVHTIQRAAYPVTAGLTYRISVRGESNGVSSWLGYEMYNGGTFLASGGRFNPSTGLTGGTGPGTLTDLGAGIYRYDKDYLIPAGVTALTLRLLLGTTSGTSTYIAAGEGILASDVTITQL